MRNRQVGREIACIKQLGFVRDQRDAVYSLSANHMCDGVNRDGPVDGLAARHCYRIVIEYFEGDIGLRCDRLPYRQRPGMIKGAVAEILKNVLSAIEDRACNPVDAFAAHLDESIRVAIHPVGHEVTADSRERLRTLGYLRRRVVRTA